MGNRRRDKEIYDRYEDGYEYDGGDDVDLGIPEQEDLYAAYYPAEDEDDPDEGELPPVPEDRESYYARRDAYYARRDAYYAERDAYYARMEDDDGDGDYAPARRRRRDPEEDRGPRRRARGRAGRRRRRKGWLLRRILTVDPGELESYLYGISLSPSVRCAAVLFKPLGEMDTMRVAVIDIDKQEVAAFSCCPRTGIYSACYHPGIEWLSDDTLLLHLVNDDFTDESTWVFSPFI